MKCDRMPELGSFALLLALVLSGYTLVAGAIALRQLTTGRSGRVSPERLAETARRSGIASFFAVSTIIEGSLRLPRYGIGAR